MKIVLESRAEREAQKAETLPAFGGLNLLHIKRQLAELLKLIGRDGIFDEYTIHDVSHVDKMLAMLEWVIPDDTKNAMTSADWLLVVLGIYFHDVGLLVTRDEYAQRGSSGFASFVDTELFGGEEGDEYSHKVSALEGEERERFLYQEYVRHHHAERIRSWITGAAVSKLGVAARAVKEINDLLNPLAGQFRRDLGLVAESHHLDDLDDLDKYRVSQPYGDSDEETANLQYAAVLLRVTDLLHITADRTPSVAYRLINPIDPLSQQEWAKQMAVTRVRSKSGCDEDGNPDPDAPRDTIEIHAYFKKEDGFFGLTAYLDYAARQISRCHEWIGASVRRKLAPHEFPWARLDDTNIETEGFIRDAFQFTIDQAKILDLLTGHTLYNDSSVVLRELVQNSLDAIRLRLFEDPESPAGYVRITWDSKTRSLTVSDNGAGMTQETISNHLLRVGASLYQDPAFKKAHPGFSSISRFGIGVLSTFMIADSVEIITCHRQDEQARRLALRSVHGKYLIRLLEKDKDPAVVLSPHGTLVRLRVRETVKAPDFLKTSRNWIIIPDCNVTVEIDGKEAVSVGFASPREAVVRHLKDAGHKVLDKIDEAPARADDELVCVKQHEEMNVTIAYAVRWSPYFHEWSFMQIPHTDDRTELQPLGTCVEGIRIDSNTPGFTGNGILALANARGENSPKTNVARTGLEATAERDVLLKCVYRAYCKHAEEEIANLTKTRGHSLTWAIQEAQFLLRPLVSPQEFEAHTNTPVNEDLLGDSIKEIPIHLIETTSGRKAVSTKQLSEEANFWTITCPLFRSAEALIREAPGSASIRSIVTALGTAVDFPEDPILCQSVLSSSFFDHLAFEGREVTHVDVRKSERRLDLMWSHTSQPARWLKLPWHWRRWFSRAVYMMARKSVQYPYRRVNDIMILDSSLQLNGFSGEMALRHEGTTFLVADNSATRYVREALRQEVAKERNDERLPPIVGVLALFETLLGSRVQTDGLEQHVRRVLGVFENELTTRYGIQEQHWDKQLRDEALMTAIGESDWSVVDPFRWEHRLED